MLRIFAGALALLAFVSPGLAQKPDTTRPGIDRTPLASSERIHSFHSDVVIEQNGDVLITETITLTALGREIRRGPYRDFPTRYRDNQGNRVEVGFDVLDVRRDGRTEPYHTERLSNGIRIFIGDADYFLPSARYTYTLQYRTTRSLYFGSEFDALYFNVTGNGWAFPIDAASATIHLPAGASALEAEAFTGRQGSTASNATIDRSGLGSVTVTTTRSLGPQEGLTIAVSFPKDFVDAPGAVDQVSYWFADNAPLLIAIFAFLGTLVYYSWAWSRVGRDPAPGTIIPLFEPPTGFSPAATRFVSHMRFDQSSFTAAIVSMAVKGYLTIKEDGKTFVLNKASGDLSALSTGEVAIAEKLLRTRNSIKLKNTNHEKFQKAIAALKSELRKEYEAANFKRNTDYIVPGAMIAFAAIALTALATFDGLTALLGTAVGLGFGAVSGYIIQTTWRALRIRATIWRRLASVFAGFIALAFAGFAIIVSQEIPGGFSIFAAILFFATGALTPVFHELMKAPTKVGREIMDQIEGFKLYLSVAEQHRLEAFHPPKQTPELFERLLPYALALGVENQWSEQFDDILKAASADGADYHPSWYHGTRWHGVRTGAFVGSLSSAMASSVASAATAPGSSSGVGGGGFSGGGFGGGGGGGW